MSDIEEFVNTDKEKAALSEINSDPGKYTKIFMRIFGKLCPRCKRNVIRNFRRQINTGWDDYCESCQKMAREEYECLK
jgi:hypothetical protein